LKKSVYSAVIFDFDGTIVDSMPDILACMKEAYAKEGVFDAKPEQKHIGPPLMECLKNITPKLDVSVLEKVCGNFKNEYDNSDYPRTTVYPGVKETIEFLKAEDAKLYLVTNKRYIPTLRMLDAFKVKEFISVVSPDIKSGELMNKTEMLAYLLKKEKIKPENAVYVGDSVTDIISAHANGIKAVAVTYGYSTKKQLEKSGPDILINSFKDLIKIIIAEDEGFK